MTRTLAEAARLVRSKNAGPFWLTIDVFCHTPDDFAQACTSRLVDTRWIADLYGVDAEQVEVYRVPELNAIKVSMPRPVTQGSLPDTDQHAGQLYVPLLAIPVD